MADDIDVNIDNDEDGIPYYPQCTGCDYVGIGEEFMKITLTEAWSEKNLKKGDVALFCDSCQEDAQDQIQEEEEEKRLEEAFCSRELI